MHCVLLDRMGLTAGTGVWSSHSSKDYLLAHILQLGLMLLYITALSFWLSPPIAILVALPTVPDDMLIWEIWDDEWGKYEKKNVGIIRRRIREMWDEEPRKYEQKN